MDGGANDEDHEGDRRREQLIQSGTWYIRLNGKLMRDKQGNPYSFRGKAAANKAALTMQAKLFNQGKEFILTTNPNDTPRSVAEVSTNLLARYKTGAAADAKKADASGDYKRGDKRFSGIVKATNKQFANDLKKHSGVAEDQVNELFEPTLNYYKLSNGKTVQASYTPTPNQSPVPFTDVEVSYVNPALKPQGGSFDSTGVAEPWTNAPDGVKQAIQKFVTQPQQGVAEGSDDNSPVSGAITRRILMQRSDLLSKYGPEKVGQAVDEVADFVGDVEEIGSSDVSGWVRHVEQMLGNMEQDVAEEAAAPTFKPGDRVMYAGKFATVVAQDGDAYGIRIDGKPGTQMVPADQIRKPSYDESVAESIDPVEQLRADIRRFAL
jgi:hypothetical protein